MKEFWLQELEEPQNLEGKVSLGAFELVFRRDLHNGEYNLAISEEAQRRGYEKTGAKAYRITKYDYENVDKSHQKVTVEIF